MSVQKIDPVYQLNEKTNGSTLSSSEWNDISGAVNIAQTKINEIIDEGTGGGVVTVEVDPSDASKRIVFTDGVLTGELTDKGTKGINVTVAGNNNVNIEPRPAMGTGEGKNEAGNPNRKGGNISLKPGDDIELWAHKRGTAKDDEVSVKVMTEVPKQSDPTKTDEVAAKLQLNAADVVLTSKDKQEDSDEMNITVNKAANTRGYLKVRAQAIDLRSESHGGIALQPKGSDGDGNINKIKFEHGGGDGLEFGTFNTEHTSMFTSDYRFNKDGVLRLATRFTTPSPKADPDDPTTAYQYLKNNAVNHEAMEEETGKEFNYADDFYDFVETSDPTCTWNDVVETAGAFNNQLVRTSFTKNDVSGDSQLTVSAENTYQAHYLGNSESSSYSFVRIACGDLFQEAQVFEESDLMVLLADAMEVEYDDPSRLYTWFRTTFSTSLSALDPYVAISFVDDVDNPTSFSCWRLPQRKATKVNFRIYDVSVDTGYNSGITFIQDSNITCNAGEDPISCSISDIIQLVNYMKDNNQGPWAQQ